ncbi:ATP-binding Cassette (ABC) superfamily [Phytophthora nicotianae]|uniref:ATP-binding Cassette (ABC) superfamily n=1 Tax=Phytophthora nicotianae TaxID=4792 RepID=A0A0W8DH36_PHYNI|nr:ATP-binding Cassette (ABC) superfamily [Phytophthora nicotianae]
MLGCASHRFNLVVNRFLADYETELVAVNNLMIQLRHCNNVAILAKFTDLQPIKRMQLAGCQPTIWSPAMHKFVMLFALQHKTTTAPDVRLQFDSVVTDYPIMAEHLRPSAESVNCPLFESALVNIGNGDTLTTAEARALKCFEVTSDSDGGRVDGDQVNAKRMKQTRCDYVVAILREGKRRRVSTRTNVSYTALAKLAPPTSNTVERLLSTCKLIMTPQRICMQPANFEMIAFLRANREMRNVTTLIGQNE